MPVFILNPFMKQRHQGNRLAISSCLSLLVLAYLALLFGNIGYPLMWADESMTAMQAQRVLQFGYPKVHDGKNVLYDLEHKDLRLGIHESTDAYIGGTSWFHYYYAAPFVALSRVFDDFHVKTAILRMPFAIAGTIGLVFIFLAGSLVYETLFDKMKVACVYLVITISSVPLLLHLREVRYYSLTFLFWGAVIFIFSRHRIFGQFHKITYVIVMTALLSLLFLTFSPLYFIAVAVIVVAEVVRIPLKRSRYGGFERSLVLNGFLYASPALISFAILIPCFIFFRTFSISAAVSDYNQHSYFSNAASLLQYFIKREFLAVSLATLLLLGVIRRVVGGGREILGERSFHLIAFLAILFSVYAVAICQMGVFFLFARYFIYLQPVLGLAVVVALRANGWPAVDGRASGKAVHAVLVGVFVLVHLVVNVDVISGKIVEICHKNKGPLDYVIPYIYRTHVSPETLVVATNYEETSYMFYLGCRTTIGFLGNNLATDRRVVPDVVVPRRNSPLFRMEVVAVMEEYLRDRRYRAVLLPVYDSAYNTLPEVSPPYQHPFRERTPASDAEKLVVLVRDEGVPESGEQSR